MSEEQQECMVSDNMVRQGLACLHRIMFWMRSTMELKVGLRLGFRSQHSIISWYLGQQDNHSGSVSIQWHIKRIGLNIQYT